MVKIVLATSSKQRKDIFDMLGIKYDVIKSNVEEKSNSTDPGEYVRDISKQKANSVASQIDEKVIIIAADSIIFLDNKIYQKPKTKEEAFRDLKEISGKTVYAYTGTTIKDLYKDIELSFIDMVEATFNNITDEEIRWYVDNEENIYNTCGVTILGKGALFLNEVKGDYNSFFGISPNKTFNKLKELGYEIKDFEFQPQTKDRKLKKNLKI